MKTRARREAGRRMRGRFSSRLSNKAAGRHHRSFRTAPEFFRLALESLTEYALITTDRDLLISSWSGPAAVMFGYAETEIIGKCIRLLFTPEDIALGIDREEFSEALRKGKQDDERWHVRKDGRRLWCYGISFPLLDEKGVARGFVKLIRDDTERKRKDDLLRESEERLRLAAESVGLGTWDYDMERRSLQLSSRAAEFFGLEEGTVPDGFERLVENIEPEDRERLSQDFRNAVAGGDRSFDQEYRVRKPAGGRRWIRTAARAIADGETRRVIGTVVDITEKRTRQLASHEAKRELERRVKERTAELSMLNKELETFAYSASHDLRAPLRKIAAFSQAIMLSGESRLSPGDQGYFDRIRTATAQMHRLLDDMLDLTRVTRKPLVRVDCDLSAMAGAIAGGLRKSAPERRVDFVIAGGIHAEGDCELLTIVLKNLLENAWKFTSRHPQARIEFGAVLRDGRPVYFVKDDGAGFDMRHAHKLFVAFRRLHAQDQFCGTGVGLGIVERIVRRHRGRIWAEAKVEEGAAFYFTLDSEEA